MADGYYPIRRGRSAVSMDAAIQAGVTALGITDVEIEILDQRVYVDGTGAISEYRVQVQEASGPPHAAP